MNRIKRIVCAVLAAVTLTTGFAACSEKTEIDVANITLTSDQLQDVQTKIDKTLADAKFSGGAYVKLNKNVLYEKYFGTENPDTEQKINKTTRYQVSSMTKTITGAAILQLCDSGKLELDDTLDMYIDAKGSYKYLKKVSIAKLLDLEVSFGAYNYEILKDKESMRTIKKMIKNGEDVKAYITKHILDVGTESGSNQAHSNYYLLGLVIEKITGETYKDYIQKNIFDKIGMKDSAVVNQKQPLIGYNVDTESWRDEKTNLLYNDYGFMFSSFGVTATIGDMFKFYNAVLDGTLTKTNLIKKLNEFYSNYGFGFKHDGHNLYAYGGTSLHTSFAYINDETKELALLCSNQVGNIRLNATGKAVYNAVNSKINGMLLDEES